MKRIRAYLVINTRVNEQSPQKIAGVFWKKRNAKNFAWQLNTESVNTASDDSFVVEKYWFVPKRSAKFFTSSTQGTLS